MRGRGDAWVVDVVTDSMEAALLDTVRTPTHTRHRNTATHARLRTHMYTNVNQTHPPMLDTVCTL